MAVMKTLMLLALLVILTTDQSEAWGRFRLRLRPRFRIIRATVRVIKIVRNCFKGDCFSGPTAELLCDGVDKAMVKREEWKALQPKQQQSISEVIDSVFLQHTGPDTCAVIGLSGSSCDRCLQDGSCLKDLILALQDRDFKQGKNDIKYNFLVGQDGVVYEGRGWEDTNQETSGYEHGSLVIAVFGDFSKSEPSQAAQDAINNLVLCGQAAGIIDQNPNFISEPRITGEAFDRMIQRCKGMCVE